MNAVTAVKRAAVERKANVTIVGLDFLNFIILDSDF